MKPPKQERASRCEVLHGVVVKYNLSPRGGTEGVLIRGDGGIVQVNFPRDAGVALAAVGQTVSVVVEPEPASDKHPPGDHPVYRAAADRREEGPKHGEPARVEGTVRELNYARHGEPNGVVLDGGDFLHLKPDGMRRVGLAVGQKVTAEGDARPMPTGGRAIEARVVNGVDLGRD